MKSFLFAIVFVCSIASLSSQTVSSTDKELATQKKQEFPDSKVYFTESNIEVDFSRSTAGEMARKDYSVATVKEKSEYRFVSLVSGQRYSHLVFSNDNIKVSGFSKFTSISMTTNFLNYFGEGIFYNDSRYTAYSFYLSRIGEDSKYNYDVNYHDIKFFNSIYFQESEPCQKKTIVITVPEWMNVEIVEMNFDGFDIAKTTKKTSYGETIYTYTALNLPPTKSEGHSPHSAAMYPHLYFCFKSVINNKAASSTDMLGNIEGLYGWYHKLVTESGNDRSTITPLVNELTSGLNTDNEKIDAIYHWVQEHIRYIAFENGIMGFRPDSAQAVLKKGYGDCKGQSNLLCEMLKIAGYDARLVWLGTKGIPYSYDKPSIAVDNHVICAVFLNNERFFLDPTEEKAAMFDYADRIQGRVCLIEDGEKFIIDTIPEFSYERNLEKTTMVLSINTKDNTLEGTQNIEINGESKVQFLYAYERIETPDKEKALNNYLRDGDKNISVSAVEISDLSQRSQPIEISNQIVIANQITQLDDELYVNPETEFHLYSYEMESDRQHDYVFPYKINFFEKTSLQVPDGYQVDYLPDSFNAVVGDFHFELSYKQNGNVIDYEKHIYATSCLLKKADFKEWNKTIKLLAKFYKEQIVLKK